MVSFQNHWVSEVHTTRTLDPSPLLIFTRRAIREYPNGLKVALYDCRELKGHTMTVAYTDRSL